ncbi:MAG: AAA family ATPase [Caulobacteraceae bacterium]
MSLFDRLKGRRPRARAAPSPALAKSDPTSSKHGGKAPKIDAQAAVEEPGAPKVVRAPRPERPAFPSFVSTAGDQVNSRLFDRFASARIRLRTAFTPGQPVTDRRMFAGRTKVLSTLIRSIEDQRLHTVLYGERGIGKTSLLHVLTQAAREARYLVVYVSCGAASEFDETIRTVAEGIPLRYHADFGPTSKEAEGGGSFADVLPAGLVSTRAATDLFAKVIGTRALVILDEFDRSESAEFRRTMAELMKSLSDRQVRLQLIIAGVAANLTELVRHIPSIQRNVFALQVPKMSGSEIRHLVNNGEEASGVAFEDEAIRAIVARAIGFPYLASLIGHHAALVAIEAGRTEVVEADVRAATNEALAELKGRISLRSQAQIARSLDKGLLNSLGAVAGAAQSSGGQFNLEDIEVLYATGEEADRRRKALEDLAEEGGLIEVHEDETGRHFRFTDEAVTSYLWLLANQERRAEEPSAREDGPDRRVAATS